MWDASLVLIKFFENDVESFPPGHFRNKKVLELGAGTGAVSVCLAMLQAETYCTDQEILVPLMKRNFQRNHLDSSKCRALVWGDDEKSFGDLQHQFDYVVLSDCIAPVEFH